nr:hypothetical protein [Tanacetum cinerariifolium]
MILESVEHGPLIWPMVEENGVIRTKKYAKLSVAEKIQADCDMKATNIILQGDDPIAYLNKAMAFLTAGRQGQNYAGTTYKGNATSSRGNTTSGQEKEKAMLAEARKAGQILDEEQLKFLADPRIPAGQVKTIIPHNAAFQTEDLDTYDSDYEDLSNAQAVLMANISNYSSNVISEVPNSDNYLNDMDNQTQTMHMLTKPQSFYDNVYKQALGYQNPFYLKNAQRMTPTLYDGIFIYEKHVSMPVIDNEETLILEEESRSKMSEKAKDHEVIAKKISHKPIDYENLNRLTDDFGKRFTSQQELLAEQAFWLRISNPAFESSLPPIRMEVPSELPKKRTTPNALTEGEWSVFDKDLLNEIMKVKTAFDQIEAAVQQSSVDKQYVYCMNVDTQRSESCEKCLNLDAESSKSKQVYNDLLDKYSLLEKHFISLEVSMQLKQEVFQNDESCVCQNAPEILEYFEKNDLKAHLKDKDITICKLKDTIKSLRKINKEEIVDYDRCDLETINTELENSVAKLLFENERVRCSTSASESKPSSNTKNNMISQPSSGNKINKVENQPRSVKTRKNNKNHVKKVKCDDHVMLSISNVNYVYVSINNAPVKNYVNDVKTGCLCAIYEPDHTWGSIATDIPSSSSLVMTGCLDCTLVSGL